MSQSWSAPQNSQSAKAIDFALVISGWPTIYTVAKSYTLSSSGDLSDSNGSGNGFDGTTKALASLPQIAGANAKGRPEEGSCTIGQLDIDLLDRVSVGRREISDLCSRQAYLNDASSYPRTTLRASVGPSDLTLPVSSSSGMSVGGGIAYVGRECVKYGAASQDGSGWSLTSCTRGYRLTTKAAHTSGAGVYPFMPNLFWRRAVIYKGYQGLSPSNWKPAFGGVIGSVGRVAAKVTFSVFDTMWLTYANGEQVLCGPPPVGNSAGVLRTARLVSDLVLDVGYQSGTPIDDENTVKLEMDDSAGISGGRLVLNASGAWLPISAATAVTS